MFRKRALFAAQLYIFKLFSKLGKEVKRETKSPSESSRSPVDQEDTEHEAVTTPLASSQMEYGAKLGE